jgi:uroporphyrinogen decarboxylase
LRDDLVDVRFVRFAPSREERRLARRAAPHAGDTRLGSPEQVSTYRRWRYRPAQGRQRNPLAQARSLADLRRFPFPEPNRPYELRGLREQVAALHARGLAAGGNPPHLGGELFEAAWRLRGLENFLIDLVRRPEWADYLLDRLAALARRNVETLARAGIDVLALDDDVGMPGTMMIGPDTWRRFFKERLAGIIQAGRAVNPELRVIYHSDGYFAPIVPDLVEIGVDGINPLQPEHMDAAALRAHWGPRPALWGTVGRQTTFSFETPEAIRAEVELRAKTLGPAGLVLCPAYDVDEPDIPWANIAAFCAAVREFG